MDIVHDVMGAIFKICLFFSPLLDEKESPVINNCICFHDKTTWLKRIAVSKLWIFLSNQNQISSHFELRRFVRSWVTGLIQWPLIHSNNAKFSHPGLNVTVCYLAVELGIVSGLQNFLSIGKRKTNRCYASSEEGRLEKERTKQLLSRLSWHKMWMQRRFFNIHQRPWNHESHSAMSRRFMKPEVPQCMCFLEASVARDGERRKDPFQRTRAFDYQVLWRRQPHAWAGVGGPSPLNEAKAPSKWVLFWRRLSKETNRDLPKPLK